jgi:hypothetical protein
MVVRENRIALFDNQGMKQRHPPNAVRLQFLSQNDTAAVGIKTEIVSMECRHRMDE